MSVMAANRTRGQVQKRPGLWKIMPEQVPGAKDAIVGALRGRQTVAAACRMANIARSTYYLWLQHDPSFAAAVDNARWQLARRRSITSPEDISTRPLISMIKRLQPSKYRNWTF
jgi:hypothetical protein